MQPRRDVWITPTASFWGRDDLKHDMQEKLLEGCYKEEGTGWEGM